MCKPTPYAVVKANQEISYRWKCARHGILGLSYDSKKLRNDALREHKKDAKKN